MMLWFKMLRSTQKHLENIEMNIIKTLNFIIIPKEKKTRQFHTFFLNEFPDYFFISNELCCIVFNL